MLYGRSAETARIDVLLAAARRGRSGALVIRGEAGVGKTALLDYAAAAAGMRILRGTGIESEAELPFAARAPGLPPALADRVLAEADGNPLALIELAAALSESSGVPVALAASLELPAPLPLPRRLQQSYYRQVAALPAPTRTFLLVAA